MKKLACALLISANLISSAFATKNKTVVRSLDATAISNQVASANDAVEDAVESAIDAVASHTSNPEALGILAWFKEHPKTTLALGLATTFLSADALYHKLTFSAADENGVTWHDDEEKTWCQTTWTHRYAVTPLKNMPKKCVYYTIALAAAVFAAFDLQKEDNESYLKQAWNWATSWIAETEAAIEEDLNTIGIIADIISSDKKDAPAAKPAK